MRQRGLRQALVWLLTAGVVLSLMGCSSASSVQTEAQQPVYFGSPPKALLLPDSAQRTFIGPLVVTTSHMSEEQNTTTVKGWDITTGGVEETMSSIEPRIIKAMEGDTARYISDVTICATVEVYVPLDTFLVEIIGVISSSGTTSVGGGHASSEMITMKGKVYTQRSNK